MQKYNKKVEYANNYRFFIKKMAYFLHMSEKKSNFARLNVNI